MGYSTRDRGNYHTPALRPAVCRLPSNKPPPLRDDGGQTRDFHMVCWQSSRATSRIILAAARACFPRWRITAAVLAPATMAMALACVPGQLGPAGGPLGSY